MSWNCPNPKCDNSHQQEVCPSCGWNIVNYLGDDDFYTFNHCKTCNGIMIEDDPYPFETITCVNCGDTKPNPNKLTV